MPKIFFISLISINGFNFSLGSDYQCNGNDCSEDILNSPTNAPSGNFDFYFPHPEWTAEVDSIFGTTDARWDIRKLDAFNLDSCNAQSLFSVGDNFYYYQERWSVTIDSDKNAMVAGPLSIDSGQTLTLQGNLSIV